MIKVSVFYPTTDGEAFDMEYYRTKHMPMVQRLADGTCTAIAAAKGLGGGAPGSPPTYAAIGELFFTSLEAFGACMKAHGAEISGDIPNYTKIAPIIQVSEVTL